jgi:class I fructose-bisphosphate aldolase
MHGRLAGTGRLLILPVDQGFEHGPDKSFAINPDAYDPEYHVRFAIDSGMSAYAAPLGFLGYISHKFAGQIPMILKMNSSNSLLPKMCAPDQAITASIKDAIELGCVAVGMTIYPGSSNSVSMIEEAREIIREAKSYGIASVVWSYPRGEDLPKEAETALDICAYAAHMASLLGAHIVKVKPPSEYIHSVEVRKVLSGIDYSMMRDRISHIVRSCFNGRRMVVFSGGVYADESELLSDIRELCLGGATGSIVGRNVFQRDRDSAMALINDIVKIYAYE